jgi:hypothetical protein
VEATDFGHSIVTALVSARDSLDWISTPYGRDPEDTSSVRDGMIVRFSRPVGAEIARLVLTVRNTPWAAEIEKHLLWLQGPDLDQWYAAMDNSPEFRDSFVDIVRREAMLSVHVWSSRSWVPVGFLPFPGPFVDKTVALPLDLREVSGPELRVRVESTIGQWMINSIEVDYSNELPLRVTKAPLLRARDSYRKDLRHVLSSSDNAYSVLEPGDEASLMFSIPPIDSGCARSFFLKSTGYYLVHLIPSSVAHQSLLQTFSKERGAFGRYTLRLFNRWLEGEMEGGGREQNRACAAGLW